MTLATLFATDKILRSHKSEIREKHRYSFPHFFPFSSQELLMLVIDLIYLFCTAEHMFKDSRMFFFSSVLIRIEMLEELLNFTLSTMCWRCYTKYRGLVIFRSLGYCLMIKPSEVISCVIWPVRVTLLREHAKHWFKLI